PPDIAVWADEEPVEDVTAADLLCRIVERRRGQKASRRVARQKISDRGATVRKQAIAVRNTPHDLSRVFGMVRHHEALGLLVPPTKAGYPVVVPVEDAGLDRRGLCRQEGFAPSEVRAAGGEHVRV